MKNVLRHGLALRLTSSLVQIIFCLSSSIKNANSNLYCVQFYQQFQYKIIVWNLLVWVVLNYFILYVKPMTQVSALRYQTSWFESS